MRLLKVLSIRTQQPILDGGVSTVCDGRTDVDSESARPSWYDGLANIFGANGGLSPVSSSALPRRGSNETRLRAITQPPIASSPKMKKPVNSNKFAHGSSKKEREDAHMARLVYEAKCQQNLNVARGHGNCLSLSKEIKKISRSSFLPSISMSSSSSTRSEGESGDVENHQHWSDSDSWQAESAITARTAGIAGSHSFGKIFGDHSSILSGMTPRISNLSPRNLDEEIPSRVLAEHIECDEENLQPVIIRESNCSRNRVVIVLLCLVLGLSAITVVVSLMTPTRSDAVASSNTGIDPSTSLPSTSQVPSLISPGPSTTQPPSHEPTAGASATQQPSLKPTTVEIHGVPSSLLPSQSPTSVTSESEIPTSMGPTNSPSSFNSQSLLPSTSPPTVSYFGSVQGKLGNEAFGYSTSLSGDGKILAVGAPNHGIPLMEQSGRVDFFQLEDLSEWISARPSLYGSSQNAHFGSSVALSDDGLVLAVSEEDLGSVRVFFWNERSLSWTAFGNDITSNDTISSISLSADGYRLAIGSPNSFDANLSLFAGQVSVFAYDRIGSWIQVGQLLYGSDSLDFFGSSVILSPMGDRLVVGAPGNLRHGGYVKCFDFDENTDGWRQVGGAIQNTIFPIGDDQFGSAISLDGDFIAVGSPKKNSVLEWLHSGNVAVYQLGRDWDLLGRSIQGNGDNCQTGASVLLRDGLLTVGSPGCENGLGSVSFYRYDGLVWRNVSTPMYGFFEGEDFGFNLATDGNATFVAVGSPAQSIYNDNPGSVTVFLL